jgi:hypothetical protein
MDYKLLTIAFLTICLTSTFSQTKKILPGLLKGKWTLTRYTETFNGETYNRPIAGVSVYEPKTDSAYKEMNQNDSISYYEFKSDRTYTLSGSKDFIIKRTGKWRTSDKDSIVTLYDIQPFTVKGPLPIIKDGYDLKMFFRGGLFLVVSHYDRGLNSTHKLYYKKITTD